MIRYRFFWSAILAMFSFAGCAYAQTVPASADTDRPLEAAAPEGQPAPPVRIDGTRDRNSVLTPADGAERAAATRPAASQDDATEADRSLQPQPTFSRKATIVFREHAADTVDPAPALSRGIQLILRR